MTAQPSQKNQPGQQLSLRAAKSGVAISWYAVRNQTFYQEIPTAFGLGMTADDGRWSFCPDSVQTLSPQGENRVISLQRAIRESPLHLFFDTLKTSPPFLAGMLLYTMIYSPSPVTVRVEEK